MPALYQPPALVGHRPFAYTPQGRSSMQPHKPDYSGWSPDQVTYMEWLAIPRKHRVPRTELAFARYLGVNPSTLWRWRHLPGFLQAVRDLARPGFGLELADALRALEIRAVTGSVRHQRLYFHLLGLDNDTR